jgi:hypothetical protein
MPMPMSLDDMSNTLAYYPIDVTRYRSDIQELTDDVAAIDNDIDTVFEQRYGWRPQGRAHL